MNIAIRSEADSRMLLYPLIRCLYPYGSICVISNNVYLRRLMDVDTLEGGFRNIRVIVQGDSDLEEALIGEDMYEDKYDFTIYDNMGYSDPDVECVIITSRVSESYLQDIVWIVGEPGVRVFRFGQGVGKPKTPKSKTDKKKKGNTKSAADKTAEDVISELEEDNVVLDGTAAMQNQSPFNEDGTIKNKWEVVKSDAEILNGKLAEAQSVVLPFPSFEDIEKMECRWVLPKVDSKLAKQIYAMVKDKINVDERMFLKGVNTNDEGGYFISGADVR